MGIVIKGTGMYVPERVLTNADLEKMVETSDEWITTRTGIKERHIADAATTTSMLACKAAEKALAMAGVSPQELDLITVATVTPDKMFPNTAALVQRELGARTCPCFDLEAACSGLLYSLEVVHSILKANKNYRKALVMHAYQQALIDQKLTKEISEDELQAYYQNNPELFKVERPLIKGLFIKVPLTAPRLAEVRRWYKQEEGEAVEKLEKYSLQHAVKYEYFYDRWMPLAEIIGMLPLQGSDADAYIEKHRQVELKDTAFYYFLHVSDYRAVGDVAPYDYARRQVKEMLFNVKQVQYLEQVKDDLYQRAEEKNRIKKYY